MPNVADDNLSFAPPPFKPAEAMVQLKRDLRELRVLKERGAGLDWKGHPAIVLGIDDGGIRAQLARKPSRSPSWETRLLHSGADVRHWLSEVRQRLARWEDED
jgi:hypothetical protein